MFAAAGFAACSDDDKDGDKPGPKPPEPPVELVDQIEYDGGTAIDIKSAIYAIDDTDLYTFYLSPTKDVTDVDGMNEANDYLRVTVRNPKGTVNPATDEFEIAYKDIHVKKTTMATDVEKVELTADLVSETSRLNLRVEVKLKSGKTLLARYNNTCTENLVTPPTLVNQYELDNTITDIGSVVEWINPVEKTTSYYFYTESGITTPADDKTPGMTIVLSDGIEAGEINLSTADPKQVSVTCGAFSNAEGTTGTLKLTKEGETLTLALDAARGDSRLRAAYSGAFSSESLYVPPTLENQYDLDRTISSIGSVVEWRNPTEKTMSYYFYTESGITAPAADKTPGMTVVLADGIETAEIDLSTADPAKVSVTCGTFSNAEATAGTLRLTKNGETLTLALDATQGDRRLRAAYTGAFATGFEHTNSLKITGIETPQEVELKQMFLYKESSLWNDYAFGLAEKQSPAGLKEDAYSVEFGLSNLTIGKTYDLSTDASKYKFILNDYAAFKAWDINKIEGVTGSITTEGTAERLYLHFTVNFPEGPTVEGEWYGDATVVTEAFDLTPVEPFKPTLKIISPAGEELYKRDIVALECRMEKQLRMNGGMESYGGWIKDAYALYFRTELTEKVEETAYTPCLTIPVDMFNRMDQNGEPVTVNLSSGDADVKWEFKYLVSGMLASGSYTQGYTSYDGSIAGYRPTEATATLIRNEDKTFEITFRFKDNYPAAYGGGFDGTSNTFVLEWKGRATKYTGSKKNDFTDEDY